MSIFWCLCLSFKSLRLSKLGERAAQFSCWELLPRRHCLRPGAGEQCVCTVRLGFGCTVSNTAPLFQDHWRWWQPQLQSCSYTSPGGCQLSSHFFGCPKSCLPDVTAALRAPQLLTDTWLELKMPWGRLLTPLTGTTAAVRAAKVSISVPEALT